MIKRFLPPVFILFLASAVYAQIPPANIVPQLDAAARGISADLNGRLVTEKAIRVAVGQFSYRNTIPSISVYLSNQIIEELTNIPGRQYGILSEAAGAEWIVSGEIVEIGNTVRVYSRLTRSGDRGIAASFHSDLERSQPLLEMLAGNTGSSRLVMDISETDSFEYPVSVEPGTGESSPVMNRSIHMEGDEDFFLITPQIDGRLVVETTGGMDTVMELYDGNSMEELESNDDGGGSGNARIRYNVRAGSRYIVKVRGYSDSTGQYGFRAYVSADAVIVPDQFENDDESSAAKPIDIGAPQRHTFHNGDDVDWVMFQVTAAGRYVITARGVNSSGLDTYIELFDEGLDSIGHDDDGGEGYDSRLSTRLESGLYYLKTECLDSEPEDPYNLTVRAE